MLTVPGGRNRPALLRGRAVTVLTVVGVWLALVAPNRLDGSAVVSLVRLPVEAILFAALMLVCPRRARAMTAVLGGAALAVVLVLKGLDLAFYSVFDRPFDPLDDWSYLGPAVGVMNDSFGRPLTYTLVLLVALLVLGLLVALPLAVVRLGRRLAAHRPAATRSVLVLGVAWSVLALTALGSPGTQVAAAPAASYAYNEVHQLHADLVDRTVFAREIAHDPYSGAASPTLLSALRGQNVLVVFVESYGRVAIERPGLATQLDPLLDRLTERLRRSGFSARSAYLRSPTFGAGSWLAHATLQSGLWVSSQQRYDQLLRRRRLTLTSAFAAAGWRTVFDLPADNEDWPAGAAFYGFDSLYDSRSTGYRGPAFGFGLVPDQYTLDAFGRDELGSGRSAPVMAEIDLVSSHHPWAPLPHLVPWSQLGDGAVFNGMPAKGESADEALSSTARVRDAYRRSLSYSLRALVGFLQRYGDHKLTVVVLGDHQPHSYVTGAHPGHDVPVSFMTADPGALRRIAPWHWQPGLRPAADAPTWRMDRFRDRFLRTFSPQLD